MSIPGIVKNDPWLEPYTAVIQNRINRFNEYKKMYTLSEGFTRAHEYYGEHLIDGKTVLREWAPYAVRIQLLCDYTSWRADSSGPTIEFTRLNDYGDWELSLDNDILSHGSHYRLLISWEGGCGERIPAYARRVVQDPETHIFTAQVWFPEQPYQWKADEKTVSADVPIIYEGHVGMAKEDGGVGSFEEFRINILPRIKAAGYNTVQLMALMEHPYYASFGYQVSSFFALSSRYGTPEDFKQLVDDCHDMGMAIIMDLVHSHAVKNEVEGLSLQDGSDYLYFHEGVRGQHPAWDSRCFNYGKKETINFLLSNCRFWMEEYRLDGFRFDGVTSMIYLDHGLGASFDHYDKYFGGNVDEDAVLYLSLSNDLIHSIKPSAFTVAEDMSCMPGIAAPQEEGGCGFDFRLTMGLPDYWIKIIKEQKDEDWKASEIWDVLNNRRWSEKHISYSESHDQALVGDKTIIFRLMDAAMYSDMAVGVESLHADRGIGFYKLINLLTFTAGGEGYMTFMGNEFGHPEWIDFPREGNGWSYHYARRQWSLADNTKLRYSRLLAFTADMIKNCGEALADSEIRLLHIHDSDGVLAYERGGLLFVVNLNPQRSYVDYGIPADMGRWKLVMNTDDSNYDGQGRIPTKLAIETTGCEDGIDRLSLYLPSRTALIFRRK
ncbi:MAG: alpha amylase C-terminal domain-containing protein [Spirochaetales bacterium]|uniref:1,4-alpha-glucan branching enzyme n=1 Tax=Candidatus Thalassospirochaeta sargassi TaxID=3119039 RepID=A0AAJ1MK04_9SPIO|nr:alpha amylase C-terminal domain-containing protein [Spirochaetales bacterium]